MRYGLLRGLGKDYWGLLTLLRAKHTAILDLALKPPSNPVFSNDVAQISLWHPSQR
jgi:hypothetical protein